MGEAIISFEKQTDSTCPKEGSKERPLMSNQRLRQIIGKKLAGHKRQDETKGIQEFNLKVNYILLLKKLLKGKCTGCDIETLWGYAPKERSSLA